MTLITTLTAAAVRRRFLFAITAAAVVSSVGFAGVAQAQLVLAAASLDESQEPPAGTGSAATGTASLMVNSITGMFDFNLMVDGITPAQLMGAGANSTPVHIHNAPAGSNGGIVVDLGFQGVISPVGATGFQLVVNNGAFGGTQGAINGPSVATNLANLALGDLYVNVHTQSFGGGEIRGQLSVVPEPGTGLLLLLGALALVTGNRFRRR